MEESAMKAALKMLDDPDFCNRMVESLNREHQERKAARELFLKSDTFEKMVSAFRAKPEGFSITSEEISYFPDRVKKEAGWAFAADDDLQKFQDVLTDEFGDYVLKDTDSSDEDIDFDNKSYKTTFGISVFMMFGQGTFIQLTRDN